MSGKFTPAREAERERLEWGSLAWLSRPATTSAKDLVVVEVTFDPGGGHNFHRHPNQEEVIYVIEGTVEQWLREEKRMLVPGDSVFIPKDTVHASFNTTGSNAKIIAILGPCVGEGGYELEDVSQQEPWRSLRA